MNKELTPKQVVEELNKYIIGQDKAKRSVAVALRDRYRRGQLDEELRNEVTPKNILMIGPTGVGKTEIARRLSKLVNAPFIKVEATKFTEVGYVGRDVDSIIRDLVEASVRIVKAEKTAEVELMAKEMAADLVAEGLLPLPNKKENQTKNPFEMLMGIVPKETVKDETTIQKESEIKNNRFYVRQKILLGELDDQTVEIEIDDSATGNFDMSQGAGIEMMTINLQDALGGILPKKTKKRKVSVKEAMKLLTQQEAHKLIDMDAVHEEAVKRAEERGIVFIDEIDKIAGKGYSSGPDVSREGVQRDILPIVEGSTVNTKYGPVRTDFMLFIGAGAFHVSKVTDLIPELQGRFPVRVDLDSLGEKEFRAILTQPDNALVKQYKGLLKVEGIDLNITEDALDEIASVTAQMNDTNENIGARRLYTVMEKLFEEISFNAPEMEAQEVIIDRAYVGSALEISKISRDLDKFIL